MITGIVFFYSVLNPRYSALITPTTSAQSLSTPESALHLQKSATPAHRPHSGRLRTLHRSPSRRGSTALLASPTPPRHKQAIWPSPQSRSQPRLCPSLALRHRSI